MPTNRIVILDKSAALLAMLHIYLWLFEEDLKEGLHGVHEKGSGKQGKWSMAVGDEPRRVTSYIGAFCQTTKTIGCPKNM